MPATAVSELAPVRVRCGFFRDGMADWVGTCRLCGDELWWGDHEGVYTWALGHLSFRHGT